MNFASPQLLLLLVPVLALTWYIGWPRARFRRRRDVASLLLRTALLFALALALAGLQVVRTVDQLAVVFLVDASDSMGADLQDEQTAFIRQAISEKAIDDAWAVVVFGANVAIDKPFSTLTELAPLRSEVLGSNTNLGEALQTAISLFPADARRRIVVLSDGQQTVGDAAAAGQLAEASGVEISYVPLFRDAQPDVRITDLTAPSRVGEGQEFDLTITIDSELATDATLLLFNGARLVQEQNVTLRAGTNSYAITQQSEEGGFLNFSAQIVVPEGADDVAQNNQLGTFTEVIGPPRVLLVASQADDIVHLVPALENAGILLDVISPAQLPADTSGLAAYESLVIVNVPATQLSTQQMERVNSYVADLGGGLVFIGGPESYGPGGYFQTPLEEALPVETQIRDQQRIPQLTLAYLVDSSGSMGNSAGGDFSNLELSMRAINLSIDFLQPTDRAAVGTFDSSGSWVAEFQNIDDTRRLKDLVNTLRPGGGTSIAAGIDLVERDIVHEPSERKHIILLTDGLASQNDLVFRIGQLNREFDVTTTVIALGANPPLFLRQMAEAGQGRYHQVVNVGQIPNIYAQETVLATRSYIEEGNFTLVQTANNPILNGIDALPILRGYVATSPRTTAQVILRGPEPFSDPLLASWQYGLGRSVAFMGDATARWASDWVTGDAFSRFWAQVINFSITESAGENIEAQVTMRDGEAQVVVDVRDDAGDFLNNLAMQASVVAPDQTTQTIRLQQVAPGRYEGGFFPDAEGSYFLGINGGGTQPNGDVLRFNEVTGWVMSYSPEYAERQPNVPLLADLATLTGGRSLADDPAAAFATTQEPRTAVAPVWPWLVVLAMILLVCDIAVRRLIVTRRDWQRLRAWVSGGDTPTSEANSQRMSSLLDARERARQRTQQGSNDERTVAVVRSTRKPIDRAPKAVPQQPAQRAPQSTDPKADGDDSTVSALLKRRRTNRDQERDD